MPSVQFRYDIKKDAENILRVLTKPPTFDVENSEYRFRGLSKELMDEVNKEKDMSKKEKIISNYLEDFLDKNKALMEEKNNTFTRNWNKINDNYFSRLDTILNIQIPAEVIYTAYLTSAGSCPFNARERYFMVMLKDEKTDTVTAHEIMHIEFIRAYGFYCRDLGITPGQFDDLKEALTVLLNEEMGDILSRPDYGYKEHQELREQILAIWRKNKDIKNLISEIRPFLK